MPHISLKMYSGRNKDDKMKIARELAKVLEENGIKTSAVSVSITDFEPENWKKEVYDKEIKDNKDLFIKLGYEM